MKFLDLKFDTWDTPIEKRLQILATGVFYFGTIYTGPLFIIIFFYLLFTPLYWLVLLYFSWIYFDRKTCERGGRPIEWYQKLIILDYFHDYLKTTLKLVPGFALEPNKNYLFACFPHGVLPVASLSNFLPRKAEFRKLYPNFRIKLATLPVAFFFPIVRELFLALESISCSSESLNYVLSQPDGGNIVTLYPGGDKECALNQYQPKINQFAIKNRKGFVRVALQNGVDLVPVITFGENDLLSIEENFWQKFRWITKKLPFLACAFCHGRGCFQRNFGFAARDTPTMTVVGNPIKVSKIEHPSKQQIDEMHEKFIQTLIHLFEEYKKEYFENPEDKFLEIM